MSDILGYNGAPLALNGAPITCSTAGTDTSGGTITSAAQILYPYVGFSQGVRYVGNIQSQAAQTIYPSTSDQTISGGQYLSGTQTIKGVTVSNLTAANIKDGVTIEIGDAVDSDRIMSVTGNFSYKRATSQVTFSGGNTYQITFTGLSGTPVLFYHLMLPYTSDMSAASLSQEVISAGGYISSDGSVTSYGTAISSSSTYVQNYVEIIAQSSTNSLTLTIQTSGYYFYNRAYRLYYTYI